ERPTELKTRDAEQPQRAFQPPERSRVEPAGPGLADPESLASLLDREPFEIDRAHELAGIRWKSAEELVEPVVDLIVDGARVGRRRDGILDGRSRGAATFALGRGEVDDAQAARHARKPTSFILDRGALPGRRVLRVDLEDIVRELRVPRVVVRVPAKPAQLRDTVDNRADDAEIRRPDELDLAR